MPTRILIAAAAFVIAMIPAKALSTTKPVLHGKHWVAVTGKPLAATAGEIGRAHV